MYPQLLQNFSVLVLSFYNGAANNDTVAVRFHLFHLFRRGNAKTNTIRDRGMLFYCIKKLSKSVWNVFLTPVTPVEDTQYKKSFAVCRNGSNTVFRRWSDKINWIHAMSVSTFINFVMFFKRKVRYNDGINSCFLA